MSDLLQIFTGNPLSTYIGKKIESATRPDLESEDWSLNMEICDIINENDDDAKDAARAIKKRLLQIEQDRDFNITNKTLTVLETCVSNCSHRFHILVMTKDFIQDLVKLIGPKNNPPIELQERVLSMIERWAEAFRVQPDLSGVVSVYNDLKAKGVTFPPRDPNSHVPIQTPQRTISGPPAPVQAPTLRPSRPSSGQPAPTLPSGQVLLEGEGYNKISQDLIVVQSSIEMFEDIMRALESPANEGADWKLAEELSVTCKQMKGRIVDLIERIANEDLTIELLRLNDELNTVFAKYEKLVNKRPQQITTGPKNQSAKRSDQSSEPPASLSAGISTRSPEIGPEASPTSASGDQSRAKLSGVSSRTLNELSLIDFNASRPSEAQSKPATTSATPVTGIASDPFDTSGHGKNVGTSSQLAERMSDLSLTNTRSTPAPVLPSGNVPEEVAAVREQDFAEIENWLSTDSGRDLASISRDMPSIEPISVPNSEFENFIASRALAGSTTSSQQAQTQIKQKQQQKNLDPAV